MAEQQITAEEAEHLREMLLKYERDKGPNVFDLSKPPTPPYTHKAFPKVVYNHAASNPARVVLKKDLLNNSYQELAQAKLVTKNVNSQEELELALEQGWSVKPPVFREDEAAESTTANILPLLADEPVEHVAPRRGRPPKHVAEV